MRAVHICTRFNRLSETFIYDLIVGLERAGVENHVLTAARLNEAERPFSRVRVLRIPVWRQFLFGALKHGLHSYRFPLPREAARQAFREIRPDVIVAHFGGTGAAAAGLARQTGIPLVVVFHAFDLFMRHFRRSTYRGLWRAAPRAVAVSEHGRERLLALGCPAECLRVIRCGVDTARFAPRPGGRRKEGALRLASVGRLVEKKGFDDLLRATALCRQRLPAPISLDIWGEGPLKRRLEELARRLGLETAATFRGAASRDAMPHLLNQYDLFALPSKTAANGDKEGIPITLLEAQASGLPVVATRHAGIPEAIPPLNRVFLAREGDVEDLTRKLLSLASHREALPALGRVGREWVERHFSLDREVAAFHALLAGAARPAPRGARAASAAAPGGS
jgi:glycosyltransferase involved in cell wall biosynthesis